MSCFEIPYHFLVSSSFPLSVVYKKFNDAALASGDALIYHKWAATYQAHARIIQSAEEKLKLMRSACDTFRTAFEMRRKEIDALIAFAQPSLELVGLLEAEKAQREVKITTLRTSNNADLEKEKDKAIAVKEKEYQEALAVEKEKKALVQDMARVLLTIIEAFAHRIRLVSASQGPLSLLPFLSPSSSFLLFFSLLSSSLPLCHSWSSLHFLSLPLTLLLRRRHWSGCDDDC